ncbi:fimbrial biogenesis chaperone [Pseudomonas denitrificans (nom. rej.)]|uniref:Fimbria/pilus periplasmic chaperone n=1 Tax=Pseudomonas denitrificans TaxID=43306 RepID=A0A9X7N558_PSEDE|nr:fimbria/pilus periplasmic chaperone [Pseudomonas denitrificans (nom. rej.)]QEY75302.1 fimbria/pilus periplasmic chaperone [Pseudomonas denitrificans (nom. rej.)]
MASLTSKSLWFAVCLGMGMLCSSLANAGIVIQGSRVVYPAKEREVTVKMNNMSDQPSLVQAWVDKGNDKLTADKADGPFLITPPIARVEAKKGQALRLIYTGDDAASKKQETVFWLNVLDVPPMPKDQDSNFLQVAVRSRLKIFYRPEGLVGTPIETAKNLHWTLVQSGAGYALRVKNDGAFHVSLVTVDLAGGPKSFTVKPEDLPLVTPNSSVDIPLRGVTSLQGAGAKVVYQWVSDYGSLNKQEAAL